MNLEVIQNRQRVLINYLQSLLNNNDYTEWKIKAEYSTNDNDKKVIVVQESTGSRVVFFDNSTPLYNYYSIDIYGLSIQECKELTNWLSYLIGNNIYFDDDKTNINGGKNITNKKWQIMFKQFTNPQAIWYEDIRRVGYNMTMQIIINPIYDIIEEGDE